MAHLTVNGVDVECSGSEYTDDTGGSVVRSLNGRPRSSSRFRKRVFRFTTDAGGLLKEDSERLQALLRGDGHAWSFDGSDYSYSSRKLVPTLDTDTEQAGGEGYWDSGLRLFSPSADIRWNLSGDTDWTWNSWTLMHWRFSSGEWHHWIRTSSGGSWRDGVSATAPSDLTFTSSVLKATAPTVDLVIDDLVLLPYVVPSAWVVSLANLAQEVPWPALPQVWVTGPGVPDSGITVLGEVGTVRRMSGFDSGQHVSKDVFDFTLHGV